MTGISVHCCFIVQQRQPIRPGMLNIGQNYYQLWSDSSRSFASASSPEEAKCIKPIVEPAQPSARPVRRSLIPSPAIFRQIEQRPLAPKAARCLAGLGTDSGCSASRRSVSSSGHLTQCFATPPIGGSDNGCFVYGWLSRTRTDLGAGMSIRSGLMPVEQTPRIRFDRSLANGAIGLGGAVGHLT
jgi:hypothetical protein